MTQQKRDFDGAAATWDENPGRVKLAEEVVQTIVQKIGLRKDMHLLDFGCGTGLLSLLLRPHVGMVTGVDSSTGMLDVFHKKIEQFSVAGVQTEFVDLEQGGILTGQYDLVVSNMTFHHVQDTQALLHKLQAVVKPGGILAVSDLDSEDGQFHGDNTGVFHLGFDREQMLEQFKKAGCIDFSCATAAEIKKPVDNGQMRTFTVFLAIGHKG